VPTFPKWRISAGTSLASANLLSFQARLGCFGVKYLRCYTISSEMTKPDCTKPAPRLLEKESIASALHYLGASRFQAAAMSTLISRLHDENFFAFGCA